MDVLYHSLVGIAISKGVGSAAYVPAAFSSVLPDIVGTIPFYYFKFQSILKKHKRIRVSVVVS